MDKKEAEKILAKFDKDITDMHKKYHKELGEGPGDRCALICAIQVEGKILHNECGTKISKATLLANLFPKEILALAISIKDVFNMEDAEDDDGTDNYIG